MRNHWILLILVVLVLTVSYSCSTITAYKTVKVPYTEPVYKTVQIPYEEPVFEFWDVPYAYVHMGSVTFPFLEGGVATDLGTYKVTAFVTETKIGTEKIQTGVETKYRSERVQAGVETKYREEQVSYDTIDVEWDKVGMTTLGIIGGAAVGLFGLIESDIEDPFTNIMILLYCIAMGGYVGYEYEDLL